MVLEVVVVVVLVVIMVALAVSVVVKLTIAAPYIYIYIHTHTKARWSRELRSSGLLRSHCPPRNSPEEDSSNLLHGGSLKSRTEDITFIKHSPDTQHFP